MQGESFQEALQGVSSSMCKVRPKAITADVFHFVLVWERGDGALRVFSAEHLVKENEIGETATNFDGACLEGGEVGLRASC